MNLISRYKTTLLLWFKAQSLIVKLRLAFASLACLTIIVGVAGLVICTLLDDRVATAYQQDLPVVSAIKEAGISQLKAMRVLTRIILAAGDNDEIDKQSKDLTADLASERSQIAICRSKLKSPAGLAQLDAAMKLVPKFEKGSTDIVTAAKAGDVVGFRTTILDLVPISDQIQHSFDQVSQITEGQAVRSKLLAVLTYWGARVLLTPLLVIAGLIAAAMSFVMSNLFAAPLGRMVRVLEAVGKGDLTRRLPENSDDEMGQLAKSLNHALGSISETLQTVSCTAEELKSTAKDLSATASGLAEGAVTQASNLEETSASLEQISATIRTNSDHAGRANELGLSARKVAEQGDASVNSAISAMDEIRNSSDEISNILSAINDMAFQSNLLAINASIEAARAGESGRSFAVVATEMRFLAERSKEHARNIERLIAKSIDRVSKGTKLVDESGKALADIILSVKNLSTTVHEIDDACKQQTIGVEHVTHAMNTVDSVIQENSLKTQTVATSARELSSAAVGLTETLKHFTFEGDKNGSPLEIHDDLAESLLALKSAVLSGYKRVRGLVSSTS